MHSRRALMNGSAWARMASMALVLGACSADDPIPLNVYAKDAHAPTDAAPFSDASADARVDAAPDASLDAGFDGGRGFNTDVGKCTNVFGDQITDGFGRIDGTLIAIVRPVDQQCPFVDNNHVTLEVRMNGAVYRLVVNVESTRAGQDPRVRLMLLDAALPAPAWQEGWHTGLLFDYPGTLGVHDATFMPFMLPDLVNRIVAQAQIGEKVSVYAVSGINFPSSAHLVHRNDTESDGAIVFGAATSTPRFLLFAFDGQTF